MNTRRHIKVVDSEGAFNDPDGKIVPSPLDHVLAADLDIVQRFLARADHSPVELNLGGSRPDILRLETGWGTHDGDRLADKRQNGGGG